MFKVERRIQFYDCDPAGILFFSKVFDICHAAYEILLEQKEAERNYFDDPDIAIPLVHAESNYVQPISYGMRVITDIQVKEIGDTSFTISYRITSSKGDLLASVKTIHVCISKHNWQKIGVPEDLRSLLEMYV